MKLLQNFRDSLCASMIDRDSEINAMITAVLAEENFLMIGPPGCGKTMLARNLSEAFTGEFFQVLLTKFTTPEEVFGPPKLSALKEDRYERAVDGYLPTATVGFVDEVFKASSAINNSMLTILEEREFDNGGVRLQTPLTTVVAASNEIPASDDVQELGALFDRYVIRKVMRPVHRSSRRKLMYSSLPEPTVTLTDKDLRREIDTATNVTISNDVMDTIDNILDDLHDAGVTVSDRRMRKIPRIVKSAAHLEGLQDAEASNLEILSDMLWDTMDQRNVVDEIVLKHANPIGQQINEILRQADEAVATAKDQATSLSAVKKLEDLERQSQKLAKSGNGRAAKVLKRVQIERARLQARILNVPIDKVEAMFS